METPQTPARRILGIGEAMLEFASVGDGLYRRGFAGDTLNTCWHIAQLLGPIACVRYCTRVGTDAFSGELIDFIASAGLETTHIARDPDRAIGLYVISLAGAERSFSYWRETSAARRLADDPDTLRAALHDCALIHVSGITLAVIGEKGRRNLLEALIEARKCGALVSFDPNVRLRLWPDQATLRDAALTMLSVTDIALPSFDDEALVWGDANPDVTLKRIAAAGVAEVVVKNGAGDVAWLANGAASRAPTLPVGEIRDTTGAGDAFNAGYLAARFVGAAPSEAVSFAQGVAGEVIGHFGALTPATALAGLRAQIESRAAGRRRAIASALLIDRS
jgi:2-dehydro-3-deoxygluconokinase